MLSSSSSEYKEALGILADCSEHITLIADAIKQQIIPKLATRQSMIDVGAGMGILTKHLLAHFDKVTVLDINPEVENDLRSHKSSHKYPHKYDVEICDFFKYETDKKYDFVLCSHVMYHFSEAQMKTFIDKLQALVKPGGYCFIALIAPRGKNHDFHIKFNADYVNSHQIIRVLEKDEVKFEKIKAIQPHHLKTKNDYAMRSLLKFFLIENCLTKASSLLQADEVKIIDEIIDAEVNKAKLPDSGEYDFEQEDDYIVIHRP
jgi:2-polyprenyl-3-methyl-5-hydroxy-6-metoxy-1,4-benzoquinol methylase